MNNVGGVTNKKCMLLMHGVVVWDKLICTFF